MPSPIVDDSLARRAAARHVVGATGYRAPRAKPGRARATSRRDATAARYAPPCRSRSRATARHHRARNTGDGTPRLRRLDADRAATPAEGAPRGLANDPRFCGPRASRSAEHVVDHALRRASSARSLRRRSQIARARSAGEIRAALGHFPLLMRWIRPARVLHGRGIDRLRPVTAHAAREKIWTASPKMTQNTQWRVLSTRR